MSAKIDYFEYIGDREGFSWSFKGKKYRQEFNNQVVALVLKSKRGILVVDPASDAAPHNAVIIDEKGMILTQIKNPEASNSAICFSDAYYIGEDLTLTIAFSSYQMLCYISENGHVLKVTESR